jgi:hypothetical protein
MTSKALTQAMQERGFTQGKSGVDRYWAGIGLNEDGLARLRQAKGPTVRFSRFTEAVN